MGKLVVISDLHCGHKVGLTPPVWQSKAVKGDVCKRNRTAKIRASAWREFRKTCPQNPEVLIINGDTIDGKGERSGGTELITADMMEQCEIAIEAISSIGAKKIICTYGTPYHTSPGGEDWEAVVAKEIGAEKIGGHEWVEYCGVVFDCKHHIGSSSSPQGRYAALGKEGVWSSLWASRDESPRSDVIIRSHVHYHRYVGDSSFLAMTTPALQCMGSKYGSRFCSGTVDWGLVVFELNSKKKGGYSWEARLKRLKEQKPTVISV